VQGWDIEQQMKKDRYGVLPNRGPRNQVRGWGIDQGVRGMGINKWGTILQVRGSSINQWGTSYLTGWILTALRGTGY